MRYLLFILLFGILHACCAQQVGDTSYTFYISHPQYKKGKGSTVYIDGAHHNFHQYNGRYMPFAKMLRNDGYVVKANEKVFTDQNLKNYKILVIANALNPVNDTSWSLPNPSAFTQQEIAAVQKWVKNGGRLFLIADHMPFGGAVKELGEAFGFEWLNGFAMNADTSGVDRFTRAENSLGSNLITNGTNPNENVDTVITFTGSAFKIPAEAKSIIKLDKKINVLLPVNTWVFETHTPSKTGEGLHQGAYLSYGKGKIVAFGEAAMFTAQVSNGSNFGLNAPEARQNNQLLLNIIHWLDQ